MKIKFKKLTEDAFEPERAHETDAGYDLRAIGVKQEGGCWVYSTGIALEIPKGYVGLIFPRSSVYKTNLLLSNCVGVIDSGYRGEILFKYKALTQHPMVYNIGDKIGQIVFVKHQVVEFIEATALKDSDRGEGGFGSTGK